VAYWESNWWSKAQPQKLRLYRDFDFEAVRLLGRACRILRQDSAAGPIRILEIGAGGSRVLPYVGRKFGCKVFGTDFSPSGCRLLDANLRLQGLDATAICEDLFQSSLSGGWFDLVYSSGLIEHFDDTMAVIREHLQLVKPGGRLVLIVPNFQGVQGKIWKRLAHPLWLRHRVFGPDHLAREMETAGLIQVESGYLGSFFMHIGLDPDWSALASWPHWLRRLAHDCVRLINGLLSLFFRLLPLRPHSRAFSPAFFAAGVKPQA
jgi:SAM-dependent methyltransferase